MSNPLALAGSVLYLDQKKKQQNLKGYTHDISLNCATCQTKILWNLWLSNVTAKLICFVAPPSLCLSLHIFFYPILRVASQQDFCSMSLSMRSKPKSGQYISIANRSMELRAQIDLDAAFLPVLPSRAAPIIPLMTSIDPTTDWSRKTKVVF